MPDEPDATAATPRGVMVIAEVAQAHDGSLGTAHAFIDAVAEAGADAVKFQTHIAAAESTPGEPWRVKFSPQDETRYAYWRRMEFSEDQWHGLAEHARERGIGFLSSPFSQEAVALLERVGVMAWKVASGEVRNRGMLDAFARTGRPVLLSTGMSAMEEVDRAVALLRERDLDVTVLQCTSMYPTPPERVGLNMIPLFRERYGCAVGLSDHSGTPWPSLAAVTLGAEVLEVHVTLSRKAFGPDVASSLTPEELGSMIRGVRFLEAARVHPVDKDEVARELAPVRRLFMKSVVAVRSLEAGTVLAAEDLAAKKPGTGIPSDRMDEVVGRRLVRPVAADQLLVEDDLEEAG